MSLVCFDTQIIIWGVKKQATPGQEPNIDKAEFLIEQCEKDKIQVMLPSIVVAELLCAIDPSQYSAFNQIMQSRFMIIPFDMIAAAYFGKMWQERKKIESKKIEGISRAEMKADLMIIATALSRKAECIYSEDGPLTRFAQDFIEVRPLPVSMKQLSIEET